MGTVKSNREESEILRVTVGFHESVGVTIVLSEGRMLARWVLLSTSFVRTDTSVSVKLGGRDPAELSHCKLVGA